jgi:hypothetical protein
VGEGRQFHRKFYFCHCCYETYLEAASKFEIVLLHLSRHKHLAYVTSTAQYLVCASHRVAFPECMYHVKTREQTRPILLLTALLCGMLWTSRSSTTDTSISFNGQVG